MPLPSCGLQCLTWAWPGSPAFLSGLTLWGAQVLRVPALVGLVGAFPSQAYSRGESECANSHPIPFPTQTRVPFPKGKPFL